MTHRWSARRVCRGKGFTLIELLVVISIIALLISLLLPALGRARDQAIITKCLSNLHGMGIGYAGYYSDYTGVLPGQQGGSGWYEVNQTPAAVYKFPSTLLYYTFSKSNPDAYVTLWGSYAPATADQDPKPAGLGQIAGYLSSGASVSDVDGRIFYDPGNPVSFGMGGAEDVIRGQYRNAVILPRNEGGMYTIWQSDWGKGPGEGKSADAVAAMGLSAGDTGPTDAPAVYGTYTYRGAAYAERLATAADAPIPQYAMMRGGTAGYHGTLASAPGWLKADSPYIVGKSFVSCWADLESWDTFALSTSYRANMVHNGQVVNFAANDGSASSFGVPSGKLQPWGFTTVGATTPLPGSGGAGFSADPAVPPGTWYGATLPYYFELVDGSAPWQHGQPGF